MIQSAMRNGARAAVRRARLRTTESLAATRARSPPSSLHAGLFGRRLFSSPVIRTGARHSSNPRPRTRFAASSRLLSTTTLAAPPSASSSAAAATSSLWLLLGTGGAVALFYAVSNTDSGVAAAEAAATQSLKTTPVAVALSPSSSSSSPSTTLAVQYNNPVRECVEAVKKWVRALLLVVVWSPLLATMPLVYYAPSLRSVWYWVFVTLMSSNGPCFIKLGQVRALATLI
jgi:hypothetical protein